MTATIEVGSMQGSVHLQKIDEELNRAGFQYGIPVDGNALAGGDGNAVEEAPVGYYRFHFWRSDSKCKGNSRKITPN